MKNNNIRISGNLLLGLSLVTLSLLVTRIGNGKDALLLFFMTGTLFLAGNVQKIMTDKIHDCLRNVPSAVVITGGIFLLDLFLKWISLDVHTIQSFCSVFFRVVTLYPFQPMDEMWYRSFDSECLLFLTLLFEEPWEESERPSFVSALVQLPGDNLPCFLLADIMVSIFPVYWYGNHIGMMRIITDLILGTCITSIHNSFLRKKDPVNQKLWDEIHKLRQHFLKTEEVLYLISVGSLYFYNFVNTTVIPDYLIQVAPVWLDYLEILNLPMMVLAGILAFLAVFEADNKIEKTIISICLLLGFVFYGHSQIGSVYSMLLLTAGACHKHADRIIKVVFTEGILMMLICLMGVQNGFLENVVNENGHALGMVSSVDCYAHWFFLFGMYTLIRKGKFHWYEYVISIGWMTYVFMMTDVKTGYVCFLLVLIMMLINQYSMKKKDSVALEKTLIWSFVICAGAYSVALIRPDIWEKAPIVWQELNNGKTAISAYPPKLLDQIIPDYGAGTSMTPDGQIFAVDNSYLLILLKYGILVSGYILFINTWFLKRARRKRYNILLIILSITAFYALFQTELAAYWYNILIVLPVANFSFLRNKLKEQ